MLVDQVGEILRMDLAFVRGRALSTSCGKLKSRSSEVIWLAVSTTGARLRCDGGPLSWHGHFATM